MSGSNFNALQRKQRPRPSIIREENFVLLVLVIILNPFVFPSLLAGRYLKCKLVHSGRPIRLLFAKGYILTTIVELQSNLALDERSSLQLAVYRWVVGGGVQQREELNSGSRQASRSEQTVVKSGTSTLICCSLFALIVLNVI